MREREHALKIDGPRTIDACNLDLDVVLEERLELGEIFGCVQSGHPEC